MLFNSVVMVDYFDCYCLVMFVGGDFVLALVVLMLGFCGCLLVTFCFGCFACGLFNLLFSSGVGLYWCFGYGCFVVLVVAICCAVVCA